MFKKISTFIFALVISISLLVPTAAFAASSYTVVPGDTMWKIALKTQTGVSEIIKANAQLKNPNLIYPGQSLRIPTNSDDLVEQEVIKLVTAERAKAGLPALKYDWELARVAKHKSQDMKDKGYFSHTSPTYGSPFTMMKNYGINYKSAGENIAKGQSTAQQVVNAWMNSSGHRANILSKDYTHIGVGYVKSGHYWTQMVMKK